MFEGGFGPVESVGQVLAQGERNVPDPRVDSGSVDEDTKECLRLEGQERLPRCAHLVQLVKELVHL